MASGVERRGISLYIDGTEVKNSVAEIKKELAKIVNAQAQMVIGSKEYEAASLKIASLQGMLREHRQQIAATTTATNTATEAISNQTRFLGNLRSSFENLPGPVGAAVQGFIIMGKALWALVANPIGATIAVIVGALALLYKAFTATDSGAVAFQGALKAVGNVLDILLDRTMSYYKMLGDLVTFDFKGMKENAKDAFGGIGSSIKDAVNAGWDYASQMDDIADREVAAANRMTKLRVEIENLKNASKDKTKTDRERMAAAQEAIDKEVELNGIEKGFLAEKNDAETKNLASKIQNGKLSMAQKEEQLKQWLAVDDRELSSLAAKDKAFADFVDKNEEAFQSLQKTKADELMKDAELAQGTRRLLWSLSTFKKELTDEDAKAVEEAQKKNIVIIEAENKKEVDLINKKHLEGKISQAQYNAESLKQEFAFLQKKRDAYAVGSKEYEELNAQISDKQVKASEQVKELLVKADKELADAKIANLKDGIEKEKELENNRWSDELTGLKKRLADITGMSNEEIALRDTINKIIEEKTAAHNYKMGILNSAEDIANLEKQKEKLGTINDNANSLAEKTPWLSSDQIKSFFDARKATIEEAYKTEQELAKDDIAKQKAAQKKYNADTLQLKNQEVDITYDAAQRRIGIAQDFLGALSSVVNQESALGKALFLFQQGLAIASIWISTAKANMKAIEILVLPPLYAPVIAANTVMAGVQTALVIAQTIGNFVSSGSKGGKGHAEGGYTGDGGKYEPAGIVHRGEYVIPQEGMANPGLFAVVQAIESARRNRTLARLELRPEITGMVESNRRTYASGGFASPSPMQSTNSHLQPIEESILPKLISAIERLNANNERLNANIEKGIKAEVSKYGTNGLTKAMEDIQKFKNSVYKK